MAESSPHADVTHYNLVDQVTGSQPDANDWDESMLMSRDRPDWDDVLQQQAARRSLSPTPQVLRGNHRNLQEPYRQPSQHRAVRHERVPDRYDGKGSWTNYFAHFQAVMEINEWNADEAAHHLAGSLRDTACRVLYPKPITPDGRERKFTLQELVGRLNRKYGPGGMAENYLSLLKQRQQQRGENLQTLADDVQQLSLQAYPEAPYSFLERLTINHFKDAVADAEVRAAIHRQNPRTLEEAVNAALDAENWQKIERSRRNVVPVPVRQIQTQEQPQVEYVTKKEVANLFEIQRKSLEDMMAGLMKERRKGNRRGKQLTCWNCGQQGHKAQQCPTQGNEPRPHHNTQHNNMHQYQWRSQPVGPVHQNFPPPPQSQPPPPQSQPPPMNQYPLN